jgi:nucleoside-diphosphate-sugar epimerase
MGASGNRDFIIHRDDPVLITGASGFIGSRLVETLLNLGFRNLRCLTRSSVPIEAEKILPKKKVPDACVQVIRGNLLSREDCQAAAEGVKLIYHLAAGRGEKLFADAFLNSVVTTRNLLDACVEQQCLNRFVNVSSFTVYSNQDKPRRRLLDESCPLEQRPELRGEAYCYAKVKQDELVTSYGRLWGIPHVIVRPGYVYGPGRSAIGGRIGINTFGFFLHLGGLNTVPLTYVDNCAEAIALAGLVQGIDGEVLNVVDDELPSSRKFLRLYKRNVRHFKSFYLPHFMSFVFCWLWERYSSWSEGQLPPAFNRRRWHVDWKKTRYNNHKLKELAGWTQRVPTVEALGRYFESCRRESPNA